MGKTPELEIKTGKPSGKSKGLSCFGKPKGAELDGEYKASADVKAKSPAGEISADLPHGDASVSVKAPELDVKTGKPSGKSKGLSCFGKPKGTDLDGEYKISANVKSPEIDVKPISTPKVEIATPIAINIPDAHGELNASVGANEPNFKIDADIPDIPKIESNLHGNADFNLAAGQLFQKHQSWKPI